MARSRRAYSYKIGCRREKIGPQEWNMARLREMLEKAGFKVEIREVSLTGFARFAVDMGIQSHETMISIAGHNYGQIGTIIVYAQPDQKELAEAIIRGCYFEILDPEVEEDGYRPEV